ncbi:MAG: hypothetical protein MJ151_01250, partial [Lachnospiraceae bacterium]|nr:hypothetical protein [Lachnospiraceae bacterium]
LIKEWHLLGFAEYQLENNKIIYPTRGVAPKSVDVLSASYLSNALSPVVVNGYTDGISGTRFGNNTGWHMMQLPTFDLSTNAYCFVQKGLLYTVEPYFVAYDEASRINLGSVGQPQLYVKRTTPKLSIY